MAGDAQPAAVTQAAAPERELHTIHLTHEEGVMLGIQTFGLSSSGILSLGACLPLLKKLGFTALEPCLALDPVPGWEKSLWPLPDFHANMQRIHDAGFETPACHVFSDDLPSHLPALSVLSERYGIRAYVLNMPPSLTPEGLEKAALSWRSVAQSLRAAGVSLLAHNGRADIETKVSGTSAYEAMLTLCGGDVLGEVDVGWVYAGGEDPVAFLRRNRQRLGMVHLKDFTMENGAMKEVPIGRGGVPIRQCVAFARENGLGIIADQDRYSAAMEAELAGAVQAVQGG